MTKQEAIIRHINYEATFCHYPDWCRKQKAERIKSGMTEKQIRKYSLIDDGRHFEYHPDIIKLMGI